MDVLSDVLSAVKLEGALYFNGEFSAPWCVMAASAGIVPYLSSGANHLIMYHFLTDGRAYAMLRGGPRLELVAGDIVVFPHGDVHLTGSGITDRPIDAAKMLESILAGGLKLARFGGGGEVCRFVCGYLVCQPRLSEIFLAGLPRILKVHLFDEPSGSWLANSIRFAVEEGSRSAPGSTLVLGKLAEVLFIETLRCYVKSMPPEQTGWLAGARDPVVGQALAVLHKAPEHSWTVAELARRAGSSRTRLAERFQYYLGASPMYYLLQWRLKIGAELLLSTTDSVAEIAAAVGYGSEASFNRAFRRQYACPPAQFRRSQPAVPVRGPAGDSIGKSV